ncbi:hypothetical protein BEV13_05840 [Rickettsiella grylli]|uniref:gamma-butyrobetaine hydroxylase-like domain-containing protein n=1 Tax=Rickettsiella grylli TaxID=59196 RepID=UPI0008FD05C4|nr:gamma-butyrobetaine hydroxylase-like domain-containing protein [Rickettsiella grylli]OIZ99430.1 hypothetical protein BEV13_05840 [Rickettsiella grylli]
MISTPCEIKLLQKTRIVEILFDNGKKFCLPCEYLRVFSPSADAKKERRDAQLVSGKKNVNIITIEPVGHYAIRFIFDDNHQSGIYTWETLYELSEHYDEYWNDYLKRVSLAGASRE